MGNNIFERGFKVVLLNMLVGGLFLLTMFILNLIVGVSISSITNLGTLFTIGIGYVLIAVVADLVIIGWVYSKKRVMWILK